MQVTGNLGRWPSLEIDTTASSCAPHPAETGQMPAPPGRVAAALPS